MTDEVKFFSKSFFLPGWEGLKEAWGCFKKLDGWKMVETIGLTLLGSIVPFYGNAVLFRYYSVKFSRHAEGPTVTKAHDVGQKIFGPQPPTPQASPAIQSTATSSPTAAPVVVDAEKLSNPPRPPSAYVADSQDVTVVSSSASPLPALGPQPPAPAPPAQVEEKGEKKSEIKARLETFLKAEKKVLGTAVDNGDCFFDAVAQQLQTKQVDSTASITSLRRSAKQAADQMHKEFPRDREKNIALKFSEYDTGLAGSADQRYEKYRENVGKTWDEIHEENEAIQKQNKTIDEQLEAISNQMEALENDTEGAEYKSLEAKYLELIDKRTPQPYPIWGSELREGRIFSEKYKVNLRVCICNEGQQPKWMNIAHPKDAHYNTTIEVALYAHHFAPIWQQEA